MLQELLNVARFAQCCKIRLEEKRQIYRSTRSRFSCLKQKNTKVLKEYDSHYISAQAPKSVLCRRIRFDMPLQKTVLITTLLDIANNMFRGVQG